MSENLLRALSGDIWEQSKLVLQSSGVHSTVVPTRYKNVDCYYNIFCHYQPVGRQGRAFMCNDRSEGARAQHFKLVDYTIEPLRGKARGSRNNRETWSQQAIICQHIYQTTHYDTRQHITRHHTHNLRVKLHYL